MLRNDDMKKRMNDLSSTLSKCAFDKDRFKSLFHNKQISKLFFRIDKGRRLDFSIQNIFSLELFACSKKN